ncbi:MAG: ferritin-like domain-containing protein [Polyangiaceae bacterium]
MRTLDLREPARAAAPDATAPTGLDEAAIATWHGRMINEHASATVFAGLAEQLHRAGADPAHVRACQGFADEERHHGVLCGAVVEALGGEAMASLPDGPPFPAHAEVAPMEGALRNVLSVGCLSETVAVAVIGAEREEMPDGELRALLTRIWSDEIGHARFGWMMLGRQVPRLDAAARQRLSAYLRVAFRHVEAHELAHLPDHPGYGPEGLVVGLCSGRDARTVFYATVTDVIVPRLEAIGLAAGRAWRTRHATV